MHYVEVARKRELRAGTITRVDAEGRPVALFNLDGDLFALADACPHMQTPLSNGRIRDRAVICSWHGWAIDIATGSVEGSRAGVCAARFPVRLEGDAVLVGLPDPEDESDPEEQDELDRCMQWDLT